MIKMNIREYREKKGKGLTEIVKAGGGYAFATRRFDPCTGEELVPEMVSLDVDVLTRMKAELEEDVQDYNEMLADIGKLK